jgi:hypothetical protein
MLDKVERGLALASRHAAMQVFILGSDESTLLTALQTAVSPASSLPLGTRLTGE